MSPVPDRITAGDHRRPTLLLVSELSEVNSTEGHEGRNRRSQRKFFEQKAAKITKAFAIWAAASWAIEKPAGYRHETTELLTSLVAWKRGLLCFL
jgi:hypothetical protein